MKETNEIKSQFIKQFKKYLSSAEGKLYAAYQTGNKAYIEQLKKENKKYEH